MAKSFNDLSESSQTAILIAAAVLVGVVLFYYFDFPLYQQVPLLEKQVKTLHEENQRNEAFEQQRVEYLNQISQMETQLATLRSMVPDEPDTDGFVNLVHNDGLATGVHIRTFVASAVVTKPFYYEMPFALRLDGTYYDLVNFFARLARAERIISVSGLTLGPPAGGGKGTYTVLPSETVGANCTLTTYYNRPQTKAGPGKK